MSLLTDTPQAFTPGPWKVRDDRADELLAGAEPSGWVSIEAKEYQTVASAYNRGYETNKANARLIAAAPELLEALKVYRAKFGHCGSAAEQADAAIAKACGIPDSKDTP